MLLFFAVTLDVFSAGRRTTAYTRQLTQRLRFAFLKAAEWGAAATQTAAHRDRTTEPAVFIQLLAELLR